ncbi:hypothetical protein KIPB_001532 [Kipferlia bialata]|uniref:Uncharacterized protein n=1 Tax=Kipferlia bialata TaxID=797122 RepID=A0A391NIS8_9EUKA|nr:hypothetical protein KIPB_001532 [Kipferlia bialata]|eukprot:g1532.t1
MTDTHLSSEELTLLVQRVFVPTPQDKGLAIIVDLPDARRGDTALWKRRRELAAGWYTALKGQTEALGTRE